MSAWWRKWNLKYNYAKNSQKSYDNGACAQKYRENTDNASADSWRGGDHQSDYTQWKRNDAGNQPKDRMPRKSKNIATDRGNDRKCGCCTSPLIHIPEFSLLKFKKKFFNRPGKKEPVCYSKEKDSV
jgi:hypothetical protein